PNSGLSGGLQTPPKDCPPHGSLTPPHFPIPALSRHTGVARNIDPDERDARTAGHGSPARAALRGTLPGRRYDVGDPRYRPDGRIGRINLTASAYAALGKDRNSFFTDRKADIRAFFAATELSYDRDWVRFRLSGAWASGDGDPFDDTESGFDAVFENPIFAGA